MIIKVTLGSVKLQRGFTLIEVLIAALVLSVGLLGLAGLQTTSQKLSLSSYHRSQAAVLAYEIADAIRANARNAEQYVGTRDPSSCDEDFSRTDSGSVSADDLNEWANRIACEFPGSGAAQGDIRKSVTGGTIKMTITVSWDDSRARALNADGTAPGTPETGSAEDLRDEFTVEIQL